MSTVNYDRLTQLLEQNRMSRRELARRIGISPDTLAGSFRRESKMNNWQIIQIANALKVTPDLFSDIIGIPYEDNVKLYGYSKIERELDCLNQSGIDKALELIKLLKMIPEYRKEKE